MTGLKEMNIILTNRKTINNEELFYFIPNGNLPDQL